MSSFPCLVRFVSRSGEVRYRLGERLVDRYLEFVAGRCRPNTLRAVAFDLKAFFAVTGKDPVEVTATDGLAAVDPTNIQWQEAAQLAEQRVNTLQ
jgi:hypothetical protein